MLGWFSMNQFKHKLPFYSTIKNLFTNIWLFFLIEFVTLLILDTLWFDVAFCLSTLETYVTRKLTMDVSAVQTLPFLGCAEVARAYLLGSLNSQRGHPVIFAFNRCHDKSLTWGRHTCRQKHPQNHITFHFPGGKHSDFTYVFTPTHSGPFLFWPYRNLCWILGCSGGYLVNKKQTQGPISANVHALFTLLKQSCISEP